MQGRCSFENLQLNVQTIERELKLPFEIISGRVQQLTIDIPWYRLLRNVPVVIKSMGNFSYFYHIYMNITIRINLSCLIE